MRSIIKELFFDTELVSRIKEVRPDAGILYQHLISGKLTLEEYLAAL